MVAMNRWNSPITASNLSGVADNTMCSTVRRRGSSTSRMPRNT
jgi:hypothetical protein